ncbi:MAG: DUF4857 domain-containing protein [Desulfovibrio sp.]|nr:DUF4857 domain-containing protein [Desulfovibrio sp.]
MRAAAFFCLLLFAVLALSWALPHTYGLIFVKPIEKTQLFYSPKLSRCIFTEQIRGNDPEAAKKSEGHHSDIVYKDELGNYYDRLAFEAALPFIYYRNMEMRGMLPVSVDGKTYDRRAIEKARRVLELRSSSLDGHSLRTSCLPLIESNPGQMALLYPDDRFRLTREKMEFINADKNAEDKVLSERFTDALKSQGFTFPAMHVGGNFTNFKPYEGGIFLTDATGGLFHLLRRDGAPVCKKIPLPDGVIPRHVLVSEARERMWLGLVLDDRDRIWLMREGDNALIGLHTEGYRPFDMDFKLIFNPAFMTAVYSDARRIQARVFSLPDPACANGTRLMPFHSYARTMSRAAESVETHLADILFPFTISLTSEISNRISFSLTPSGHVLQAVILSLLLALFYLLYERRRSSLDGWKTMGALFICAAGVYALIPLLLLEEQN